MPNIAEIYKKKSVFNSTMLVGAVVRNWLNPKQQNFTCKRGTRRMFESKVLERMVQLMKVEKVGWGNFRSKCLRKILLRKEHFS